MHPQCTNMLTFQQPRHQDLINGSQKGDRSNIDGGSDDGQQNRRQRDANNSGLSS